MSTMPSSPDTFTWLHITDLHFGLKGQAHLWPNLRQPFFADLAKMLEKIGRIDAVLFTGDLVQQGTSEEFTGMQAEVLDRLWQMLARHGSGDAVLLAVPGNHDMVRPKPSGKDGPAVKWLLEPGGFGKIEDEFWPQASSPYRTVIADAFANYSTWWQGAPWRASDIIPGIITGDFACTLPCGARKIGIVGLNTAFLQLGGGNYHGRLVWDAHQLHAVCGGAADDWVNRHDVCLLMTHQGPDWLTPAAQKHGDAEIAPAGRFALHLFGHMHETGLQTLAIGGNPALLRRWQGASLFSMEPHGQPPTVQRNHGYTIGQICFDPAPPGDLARVRVWPRAATCAAGPWRFIRDEQHAVLQDDGATAPESLTVRSLVSKFAAVNAPAASPGPATALTHAANPTPASQAALDKLAKLLKAALDEPAAAPFARAMNEDLNLPTGAPLPDMLTALDTLPTLAQQMYTIQRALKPQTLLPKGDQEHAIERAAAALYLRAALRTVQVAAAQTLCPNSAHLTVLPKNSTALVAVLMGALRGEVQQLALQPVPDQHGHTRQQAGGKALINLDEEPFYPLRQEAAIVHEMAKRVIRGYNEPVPPATGVEQAKLEKLIKSRVEQNREVHTRFFRFISSDPKAVWLDEEQVLALYEKLGIPTTRIVPQPELDLDSLLGLPVSELDDLFLQFLEMLDDVKNAGNRTNLQETP